MVKNMGKNDKIVRLVLALAVGILIIAGQLTGAAAVVLGIIALVFIATSVLGTCPLYTLLKISTRKK